MLLSRMGKCILSILVVLMFNLYAVVYISIVARRDRNQVINEFSERFSRISSQHEIVVPALVDENGQHISYDIINSRKRTRREVPSEIAADYQLQYKLSAFGRQFHLNLSLNTNLVTRNFLVEYLDAHGVSHRHRTIDDCHYHGHAIGHRISSVAISNCKGLHGLISTADGDYFVEPIQDPSIDVHNGHPHVIYRRETKEQHGKSGDCGVTDSEDVKQSWWMTNSDFAFAEQIMKQHQGHKRKRRRRRRREVSILTSELNVETLVVADKLMNSYHEDYIESYLLTLMNIVADLYHDASVGNAINIVISRIVLILQDQKDLTLGHHADMSLQSFCQWQRNLIPPENMTSEGGKEVYKHDNAVLITRYDICMLSNQPCETIGLASVGVMCSPTKSCNINEDTGLATAFTIAHEIGHNFGMKHDGDGNACGTRGGIMAGQITVNTDPFSWSTCSQDYITGYIVSGKAECLGNSPPELVNYAFPTKMPGELVDGDHQCQLQYGPSVTACVTNTICRELTCLKPGSRSCWVTNMPAAEGTKCHTRNTPEGWCYQGGCVPHGERPQAVNGGWGTWSDWSSCSRTCGGGVTVSERQCNNPKPSHRGLYCTGERSQYKTCNIDDCPANSRDFRSLQCANFNNEPYNGRFYLWEPYISQDVDACELTCITTGGEHFRKVDKIEDGTRCYPEQIAPEILDVCIYNKCHHVGCDKILGSDVREDKCRICMGDGSTCETVSNNFTTPLMAGDYHEIFTIPRGSVHIKIEEMSVSRNYLALKSVNNAYYLNAEWIIDWPKAYDVSGTTFKYERPDNNVESLTALGPINEELVVMLLVQEDQQGISYSYSQPVTRQGSGDDEIVFTWNRGSWSVCSAMCAGGESVAEVWCIRYDDKTVVSDSFCNPSTKPSRRNQPCNTEPCPPVWSEGAWSECSQTCGGGHKTRTVLCMTKVTQLEEEVVEESQCTRHKPLDRMNCGMQACPPMWVADVWSPCNPSCGQGHQTRRVSCMTSDGDPFPNMCNWATRPSSLRECQTAGCPPPRWVAGEWSQCNTDCGRGQQQRQIRCLSYNNVPLSGSFCQQNQMPNTHQQCERPCVVRPTDQEECMDATTVQYCPLVVKYKFCTNEYFRNMCCQSCLDQ